MREKWRSTHRVGRKSFMQCWHTVIFQVPGSEVSIKKFHSPARGSGLSAVGLRGLPLKILVSGGSSEDQSSPVAPVLQRPPVPSRAFPCSRALLTGPLNWSCSPGQRRCTPLAETLGLRRPNREPHSERDFLLL